MSYNLEKYFAPTEAVNYASDDEWSTHSDWREYISPRIIKYVRDIYSKATTRATMHEIVFDKLNVKRTRRLDSNLRRKLILDAYNTIESRNICLDLIKYYNKYGFLNDRIQYTFIKQMVVKNINYYANRLGKDDVNNIKKNKYYNLPHLNRLAALVRTHHYNKLRNDRSTYNKCKYLIGKIKTNYINPYVLLDVEEGAEIADEAEWDEVDLSPSTSRVQRRIRVRVWDDYTQINANHVYRETVIPDRDPHLLSKLHLILKRFIESRKAKQFRQDIELELMSKSASNLLNVQPEMMEPQSVDQQQEAGPVVLNALEQDETVAATEQVNNDFWVKNSTGDAIVNQPHASSMEILAKQFQWKSEDVSNYNIFNLDLPVEAISQNPNHPAAMLFNQYAYWNGDIKVRIHINTTPFHIGKLIFSWYYAQEFDYNSDYRNNIASSVMLPHVNFNAADGNDVVLEIPYRNYRSMLCTKNDNATDSKPLNLGSLRCHVFNPLILSGSTVVDGYVHVSFINNSFTGISPRIPVQAEMMPIKTMVKAAEKTMRVIDAVANLDKPANPAPPTMYMPQLTDSFASGTNDVNNVHMLRLDPVGQTPHPIGSSTKRQETLISNIIKQPGLLRLINWETSSARGYNLLKLNVTPELNYTDYYHVKLTNYGETFSAVVLPPISAIASINAYNRGSIKYTIEIICSKYHAGALLCSFTPRQTNVNLATAIQSYNATLDIGNVQSYDFVVPYINERPYNPRFNREVSSTVNPALAPIGEFNIFVLNELRTINNISNKVYVNVYMSAGDDFEVAVPVPPLYTVNYEYRSPLVAPAVYLNILSNLFGLDTWRYFSGDNKLVVCKTGTPADDVAILNNAELFTVYEFKELNNNKLYAAPFKCAVWRSDERNNVSAVELEQFSPKYFARIIVNGDGNKYNYITCFYSLPVALSYVACHKSLVSPTNVYPDSPTLAQWVAFAPRSYYYMRVSTTDEASYRECTTRDAKQFPFTVAQTQAIQPEMDNVIVDPTVGSLPSAMNGLRLYGEAFTDLKDYGRRYQLYGSATVKVDKDSFGFRVRVPITPIGLSLDSETNGLLHTITREGMIGYIASAYRFYRGSLRFKILFTTHKQPNVVSANQFNTWYIQHKPDIMLNSRSFAISMLKDSNASPSLVLQSGYAYTAFSPHINNSITFEIPCYIPTNLLMLQRPNFTTLAETLHYTLGCFDIYGYTGGDTSEFEFTMHYSLADDMDFSCYVGFPPMSPLYTLPTINSDNEQFEMVQPEMSDVETKEEQPTTSKAALEKQSADSEKVVEEATQPEGVYTTIKNKVSKAIFNTTLASIREDFNLEKVEDDSVCQLIVELTKKIGTEYKDLIVSMVSQILHCMISPNISTFITALITMLAHLGLAAHGYLVQFTKWFTSFFSDTQPEADDTKTESSSNEVIKQSFIMTIVGMSASMFGKSLDWVKSLKMPNFVSGTFNNIKNGALTITACITMFRNLIDVVPKIWSWLARNANPVAWYRWIFADKKDFVARWVSDVEWFTDPNNLEKVKSNMKYAYHGEMLVIVGRDICLKLNKLDRQEYDGKYITMLMSKLQQIHQILVSNFKSISGVGVEPYSFRLVGDSQCGKSYVSKELIYHCLDSVGYKSFGNLLYVRPKTKHFDGLTGSEAAIYYDDFLHIKTDEMASEQISELLTLKSKCLFVPPRAELSDKGKPFNPLIVAATMNELYPDFSHVCADKFAWMNRFDELIKVRFVPPAGFNGAQNCNDLPYEVLCKYDHCMFQIYKYRNNDESHANAEKEFKTVKVPIVKNGASKEEIDGAKISDCSELNFTQLKWYLATQFDKQMETITKECVKDLDMINKFRPDVDDDFSINIDKYMDFIRIRNRDVNMQEADTIKLVNQLQKGTPCSKCSNSLMVCPCKIIGTEKIGQLAVAPEMGLKSTPKLTIKQFKEKYDKLPAELKAFCNYDILHNVFCKVDNKSALYTAIVDFLDNDPHCCHKYINIVKSSCNLEIIEEGGKFSFCTFDDSECPVDDTNCCKLLSMNPEYAAYVKGIFKLCLPRSELPSYIPATSTNLKPMLEKHAKRISQLRAMYSKFIEAEVDKESWISKHGTMLFRICKSIGIILAFVASFYAITHYKDIYNKVKTYNPYSSITTVNKQYAKQLEEHTVTEECLKGECPICILPQMAYDEKRVLRRPRRLVNAKTAEKQKPENQPEMASEFFNSLNSNLKRNYFYIVAEKGVEHCTARCLGIQGRYFLAIDHYFDKFVHFGKDATYYYCDQQQSRRINFNEIIITKVKNSAVTICQLPRDFPAFKNIIKRFVGQDYVENVSPSSILYEPQMPEIEKLIGSYDVVLHRNNVKLIDDTLPIPDINGKDSYTHCEWYWEYQTSGKGLCGSVLITDMNTSAPIIGIHVAGRPSGGCGYAELVCRETLENIINSLEPEHTIIDVEVEGQMFNGNFIKFNEEPSHVMSAIDGDFNFAGTVPSRFAYRPPTKSKLQHTICYNQITKSTYDYPHLSHRDTRFEGSPMVNGCLHHTDPPLSFPEDILTIVHDDIKNLVLAKVKPVRATTGVLSIVDAICGLPHIPQYGAMELDTSEGFPFSSIRPKGAKDKRWLFDLSENSEGYALNSINSVLLDVMATKQSQREQGIVPMTVFTDCLKDAKLPAEKCHKTRIFSVSPVDFTIQFRQYFYDFTIAFQETRFNIESAVGINVDSYEWNQMVNRLLSNSTKFVCGDYSKFGPRLMSNVVIRFFEIICDWYALNGDRSALNRRIRMIMAHEIAFSHHLMLNMVYQVVCGAPSGCPITTILNNGVNMFYLRTAFVSLARENNLEIFVTDFNKYISVVFYGDDLIMTVKDDILEWFNATSISKFFEKYDIKFTDALKTGSMSLHTTVFAPETSFLKRNIKRHESRPVFTAAMDKRAVEETCNWTFINNDPIESAIISCESMLLNAHGHGSEYYDGLRERVLNFWRQFGEYPSIPCWRDVDWRVYEGIKPISVIEE